MPEPYLYHYLIDLVLEAALDCLLAHLPIEMEGGYTPRDLFEILLRAASRMDSIEHTAQRLKGVPTGNGIRYHLDKLDNMAILEQQLNQALQSRIPSAIAKTNHRIAIDLNLIPYYGTANAAVLPYLYRSQAKAGTTSFFAYATIYVICRHKRVTLSIHAVHCQETLVATLTYLLSMLHPLRIRVKRLYLDRGFYSVPVILSFIMVNLWVYLLWFFVSRMKRGGRRIYRELFSLKTMLEFLSQAVERHFPVTTTIYLPALE